MMKAISAGNPPYSKFMISVGIILISAVLFTILSTILITVIFGMNTLQIQNMMNEMDNPANLSALKLFQTLTALGTFVLPPFILAYIFSENPGAYLFINRKPNWLSVLIVMLIMIIGTPLINFLGELNSGMHLPGALRGIEEWMKETEDKAAVLTKAFLKMDTFGEFIVNLIMIGLIPAIGEELVFRGIVQKLFAQQTRNVHAGVWIAAILFSAIHMQFYGFVPRMILGVMLGYMLVWSGNIWLPIAGHFVNNAGAVIFMYLFQNGYSSIDPDKVGTGNDFAGVAVSLVMTIALMFTLYKRRQKQEYDYSENKLQNES